MSAFPVRFTFVRPTVLPDSVAGYGRTRTLVRKKLAEMQALGKIEAAIVSAEDPQRVRNFDSVESATEYKNFLIEVFTNDSDAHEFLEAARAAVIETV